jgi:hypothetical protein
MYKSLKAVTKVFFHFGDYFLEEVAGRKTINAG